MKKYMSKMIIAIVGVALLQFGGCSKQNPLSDGDTSHNPPATPTELTATVVSSMNIELRWKDNAETEQGFKIERKSAGENWTVAGKVNANVETFTDSYLTLNRAYFYRVFAYSGDTLSSPSNEVSATPTLPAPSDLTVTVNNSTSLTLAWADHSTDEQGFRIERKVDAGTWGDYLNLQPNSIAYSDTGLVPGKSYYYRVVAFVATGLSERSNEVTAHLAISAPTNLTATVVSATVIGISWVDNSSDEYGFRLERAIDDGSWSVFKELPANSTAYSDSGLVPNRKYGYRLKAFIPTGESDYSNEVSGTPALLAPSGMTITGKSSTGIELVWEDNSAFEDGFRLERKIDSDVWSLLKTLPINSTMYSDTGLSPKKTYSYRILAFVSTGQTEYSNEVSALLLLPAPTNLTVVKTGSSSVQLAWEDNSADETGFRLERRVAAGAWATAKLLPANSTEYADDRLVPNQSFDYRVVAYVLTGESEPSNELTASTTFPAPANLVVTGSSSSSVQLAWEDMSADEMGFRIERKIGDGAWGELKIVMENSTGYTDSNLIPNTTYSYRVQAYVVTGFSGFSNVVARTLTFLAPSNLIAEPVGSTAVRLNWTDNSADEEWFEVERKDPGGNWNEIAQVTTDSATYLDSGLAPMNFYSYRVRAYVLTGRSAYSNTASATPTVLAPSGLTAKVISSTKVDLAWNDNTVDESGFRLERRAGNGVWSEVAALPPNATTFNDIGLVPQQAYSYRVLAFVENGFSSYSNEASAIPNLLGPTNLTATVTSSSLILLKWKDPTEEAVSYEIERKIGDGAWLLHKTQPKNSVVCFENGLTPNTLYHYRVRSATAQFKSGYSDEVAGLTPRVLAPTQLTAKHLNSTQVRLDWVDNTIEETGFRLERKVANGEWSEHKKLYANSVMFIDSGLVTNTTYAYRVSALTATGESQPGNIAEATPLLPAPTKLSAYPRTSSKIELYWTDNSSDESGFVVEKKIDEGEWEELIKLPPKARTMMDSNLVRHTYYNYRVAAFTDIAVSEYSNESKSVTVPFEYSRTLEGHTDDIWGVDFSPDGKLIASCGADKVINVWDAANGNLLHTLKGHTNIIYSVKFTNEGNRLASGSSDQTIRIWDWQNEICTDTIKTHKSLSLAFTPNDNLLVSGGTDGNIQVWAWRNRQLMATIFAHVGNVNAVAMFPDGAKIVSGSKDMTVKVWRLADGVCTQILEGHEDVVYSVDVSSNGDLIASGDADGVRRLWTMPEGECTDSSDVHSIWLYSIAISPDGEIVASAGYDRRIVLFDPVNKLSLGALDGHRSDIRAVAFSPDGKTIVSGSDDKTLRLWK